MGVARGPWRRRSRLGKRERHGAATGPQAGGPGSGELAARAGAVVLSSSLLYCVQLRSVTAIVYRAKAVQSPNIFNAVPIHAHTARADTRGAHARAGAISPYTSPHPGNPASGETVTEPTHPYIPTVGSFPHCAATKTAPAPTRTERHATSRHVAGVRNRTACPKRTSSRGVDRGPTASQSHAACRQDR